MKYLALLTALLVPLSVQAEDYLSKDTNELRFDITLDNEAGTEGDPGIGFDFGFGQSLYPMDIVSINVAHEDNDDDDLTSVYAMAEEHWSIGLPLVPYVGLGMGYGWLGLDGGKDEDSIIFRADIGAKLRLTEKLAVSAALELSWADNEIYTKDRTIEDKNIEIGIGLRYYW